MMVTQDVWTWIRMVEGKVSAFLSISTRMKNILRYDLKFQGTVFILSEDFSFFFKFQMQLFSQ